MNDFENNFEQYLKHIDLVKKNEPEKYEFIKEIFDSIKDIELSKFIENVAISFEKHKTDYSELNGNALKKIFIKEQLELYTYANHKFKRFGDYTNETFTKYQPIFIEALEYWKIEFDNLRALPPQQIEKPKPEQIVTELSKKIRKHFGFMLGSCPSKAKQILVDENDFNKLINWTTYFFENNCELPNISEPIKSVNTNKYITQLAFQILFDELRKTGFHNQKVKSKTQLFELWESSFLDYKGDKKSNFYKVRKRNDNGSDYEIDVKILMLIN